MCTQPQQDFFKRIFPHGIDRIPEEKLDNAYDLCYRTIVKNQKQKDAPQKSAEAVVNSI